MAGYVVLEKPFDTKDVKAVLDTFEKKSEVLVAEPLRYLGKGTVATSKLTLEGVLASTNAHRKEHGLPPLKLNTKLSQAAAIKVDDMLAEQYFAHVSPSGVGASDLAKRVGYDYILVGENLALGNFEDDAELVQAWMDSPGHRANILHARFTEIGISAKKGTYEGKTTWMAVQQFGVPSSSCPILDTSLKTTIEKNKAVLAQVEEQLKTLKADIEAAQPKSGDAYRQKVEYYNGQVGAFNAMVASTKSLVEKYNREIGVYNDCIEGN